MSKFLASLVAGLIAFSANAAWINGEYIDPSEEYTDITIGEAQADIDRLTERLDANTQDDLLNWSQTWADTYVGSGPYIWSDSFADTSGSDQSASSNVAFQTGQVAFPQDGTDFTTSIMWWSKLEDDNNNSNWEFTDETTNNYAAFVSYSYNQLSGTSENGLYNRGLAKSVEGAFGGVCAINATISEFQRKDIWLSMWIKPSTTNYVTRGAIGLFGWQENANSSSRAGAWFSYADSFSLRGRAVPDAHFQTNYTFDASATIPTGQWNHIVFASSLVSTSLTCYINGELFQTAPNCVAYHSAVDWYFIGNSQVNGTTFTPVVGEQDNFILGKGELSASQVTELYNAGVGINTMQAPSASGDGLYQMDGTNTWTAYEPGSYFSIGIEHTDGGGADASTITAEMQLDDSSWTNIPLVDAGINLASEPSLGYLYGSLDLYPTVVANPTFRIPLAEGATTDLERVTIGVQP